MTIEQIRSVYEAKPFRAFVIHLADGRQVPVKQREFIMSSPSGRTIVVCQEDDSICFFDLPLIADLEMERSSSSSGQDS